MAALYTPVSSYPASKPLPHLPPSAPASRHAAKSSIFRLNRKASLSPSRRSTRPTEISVTRPSNDYNDAPIAPSESWHQYPSGEWRSIQPTGKQSRPKIPAISTELANVACSTHDFPPTPPLKDYSLKASIDALGLVSPRSPLNLLSGGPSDSPSRLSPSSSTLSPLTPASLLTPSSSLLPGDPLNSTSRPAPSSTRSPLASAVSTSPSSSYYALNFAEAPAQLLPDSPRPSRCPTPSLSPTVTFVSPSSSAYDLNSYETAPTRSFSDPVRSRTPSRSSSPSLPIPVRAASSLTDPSAYPPTDKPPPHSFSDHVRPRRPSRSPILAPPSLTTFVSPASSFDVLDSNELAAPAKKLHGARPAHSYLPQRHLSPSPHPPASPDLPPLSPMVFSSTPQPPPRRPSPSPHPPPSPDLPPLSPMVFSNPPHISSGADVDIRANDPRSEGNEGRERTAGSDYATVVRVDGDSLLEKQHISKVIGRLREMRAR